MKHDLKHKQLSCSFCASIERDVDFLVEGDNAFICDLCITKAQDALITNQSSKENTDSLLKPKDIKKELDQFIIGQDQAKITLSVAVYNHYKRILLEGKKNMLIDKSNEGILAFITNNGYLDNPTFRGMRYNIIQSFYNIHSIFN